MYFSVIKVIVMKQRISNVLKKDVREINKVFLSLFSVGIMLIAIFIGVSMTKTSYALFTDTIKGEKTIEVVVDTLLNKTTVFSYTGSSQEYEVPKDGYYYIEMAGASGGYISTTYHSGQGAKTSGYIYLEQGETLYFYVGQKGTDSNTNCRSTGYEFNGGGIAKPARSGICGPSGGGATDVRLVGGAWDNTSSLISRIMVAGAGGGPAENIYTQGYGGTLYGGDPIFSTYQSNIGNGGAQTSGGAAPTKWNTAQSNGTAGSFGKGGYGGASNATNADSGGGAGGGSGYYGGSGASGLSSGSWPGGGGSSYISGYAGVNSVEESTTITHTNQTLHYSGKYFIGGKMLAGQNEGNGYAKITYVGTKPKKKTDKLNNVRYIKNCTSYNTANNGNHWIEVQAIKDGVNIAKGKSVTGTTTQNASYPYSRITDGDITYDNYAATSSNSKNQCITVDLGDTYDLDEVAVWNYFGDQRRYYDNITSISSDNNSWTEVIDEAGIETSNGHRINAYTDTYNGYIQDGLVLWLDSYANTGTTRNHTTTTWKDLSGTGNNVTVSGATWYNNYLSFDGTNDYAYKTSGAIYNISKEHTIEVLVKPKQIKSSFQSVFNTINTGSGVSQYGGLWINTQGYFGYETADGSTNNVSQSILLTSDDLNKMYLMTSVRNDKNYKFYNKTNLLSDRTVTWDARTPNPAIYLGGLSSSTYLFNGEIYSIRVYNKALTEDEILHNYLYDVEKFNLE